MESEKCRVLLCAIDKGSITAAAEAMGYTISGVSRMMAALEAELGLPLLKRSKSGTSLTEAGQALVPMAEQLVQCYQAIETFADAQRRQPRTLTIAYTGPMEQQLLLRAIPAFGCIIRRLSCACGSCRWRESARRWRRATATLRWRFRAKFPCSR